MYKLVTFLLFVSLTFQAQTKTSKAKPPVTKDTVAPAPVDTLDPFEEKLKTQRTFGVYTKRPKTVDKRMKLCINLVSPGAMLNICVNDSFCKEPEVGKILFEKINGDTTYVLVLADAFTKVNDKPSCDGGKETKLFFIRWNTNTNKAIWKQRTVSSCLKAITNMTKEPIVNWDGSSPLVINYHKGGNNYAVLKFDPVNYLLGFQSTSDN